MITINQAVQSAKTWCMKYNIEIDQERKVEVEQRGHVFFVTVPTLDGRATVLVDIETGGIINDIVF